MYHIFIHVYEQQSLFCSKQVYSTDNETGDIIIVIYVTTSITSSCKRPTNKSSKGK